MFDISFFEKIDSFRDQVIHNGGSVADIMKTYQCHLSSNPFVFNIETTNMCNMRCIMCPRTSQMTRKVGVMNLRLFEDIIDQINPHKKEAIDKFHAFVQKKWGIHKEDRTENAFYFYMVSSHLTLHGYGEPVLDSFIVQRVKMCSDKKIPTYFSCVPANIDLKQIEALMDAGLGVIKFALDSLTDEEQKRIRGDKNNFKEAYAKILDVIKLKDAKNYKTEIVVTLVELESDDASLSKQKAFVDLWKDENVYAYVKSQDNRWYYEQDTSLKNKSHYAQLFCEFPWTSMTVLYDGSVVPCTQDYNAEMILGDANKDTLESIWNSTVYNEFRKIHIGATTNSDIKCFDRCDLKTLCQKIKRSAA